MAHWLMKPWDGSKRTLYRTVATAIGCNPYTVRNWDREGGIKSGILSYLEDDNETRYASRRKPKAP